MDNLESNQSVYFNDYYGEWHGHPIRHLNIIHNHFRRENRESIIWLAGDSSLDNKYWLNFQDIAGGVNGYENLMSSHSMLKDVCFFMNREIVHRGLNMACINTSIEATTLGERYNKLRSHDKFISENIQDGDVLVVSVGGNDIALAPSAKTISMLLWLVYCSSESNISAKRAWGLGHFVNLFKVQVESYIKRIIKDKQPRKIIVCMIYFPDENSEDESWANFSLGAMYYNKSPSKLQTAIRTIFEMATSQIEIPGVEVIPCPLFQIMDGKDTNDYIDRVEPSAQGGEKMARFIMDLLKLEEE